MHMFTKKKMAAVVAGLAVVGTSGVAFGYWTNAGSGSGTAATGTNAAITVNQTVDSSAPALYPGGPARTLSGTFTNPNPGKVYVANVTATASRRTRPVARRPTTPSAAPLP